MSGNRWRVIAAVLLLAALSTEVKPQAAAAQGLAFTCSPPTTFLSQGVPAAAPTQTQLYFSTAGAGTFTYTALGAPTAGAHNALGYHPTNHHLYAVLTGPLNPSGGVYNQGNVLLQIDGTGAATRLGAVTNLPYGSVTSPNQGQAYAYASGAFDASGTYWVVSTTTGRRRAAYGINVTISPPNASTTLTLSQDWVPIDWTFQYGFFWGLDGTTIYRMNPSNGNVSTFAAPSGISPTNQSFGAAWTFTNGTLGFGAIDPNRNVYQMAVTNTGTPANPTTPTFTMVARYSTPTGATSNDGAACVAQPTVFTLTKVGPAAVAPGGVITWTLVATNTGPGTSSGFSVTDTIPAGVTNVATATPGCDLTGTLVTCSGGVLAAGSSVPITITGTAPTTATCVTNSGTVLGNESPGPVTSNAIQTCVTSLALVKAADVTSVGAAGDVITYSFTVTNRSAATVNDISVTDTPPAHGGSIGTITCTPTSLTPGSTATCTAAAPYTVTAADIAAGEILDTATAAGVPAAGGAATSNPYSVSVDVQAPQPGWTATVVNTTNTIGLTP